MAVLGVEISWARLSETAAEVVVGGELDLHDVPELERVFSEARDAGAARLLVDLSAVTFLDSTVLGVLISASRRFESFVLAVGDYRVLRVLEITGLDRKLRVERSRCEALALLALAGAA